uniref:NADH:ubiquinone reductase (H(+)-translocating) n=1 Tax=Trichuris sp. GHL-2013 TaxID=1305677 RepID=S4U1G0_9BILA|nr:NADH dehydrogenase subunit 5 [Trichuris sp. GHL-2013]
MMITIRMYLLFLSCVMLLIFLLKGNIYFFTMSVSNFTANVSFIYPDKLLVYFNSVICLLSGFIIYFTFFYMKKDMPINRFMVLMMIFVASMIVTNSSNSCWTTWLGWEGLGITSYFLIMFYNNWKANNSATSTIMLNRIGDFCLLLAMLNFIQAVRWDINNTTMTSSLLLLAGVATLAKSAQIPLQSWLPIAMAAPTPVSSLVHSSTLVVAGVILCIKLNLLFYSPYMNWLCVMGYLTSFYSSLMALLEKDFKKILAYSTMSQIALVMFMAFTNLKELMLMHIVNHALIKALLFMSIGVFIVFMFGNQDSRLMHLTSSLSPAATVSSICLFAMCGVTFTSSFYSKEYALLFPLKEESILSLINLMIFLSFAYSIRLVYLFFQAHANYPDGISMSYPCLNTNMLLVPPMLANGWIFMFNYSLPINVSWAAAKNFSLLTPLIMITLFYSWVFSQWISNNDTMYTCTSKSITPIKNFFTTKVKSINLSFNLGMFYYTNFYPVPWVLSIMLVMVMVNFM